MIPRLLDSTKTLTQLAADTTAGLGSLAEAVTCTVTEERNGAYTLQMRLPITAAHYSDVTVGGVIRAKANDNQPGQLFRIQKISRPIGGIVTINANHISYDLGKTSVAPCDAVGASATMAALKSNMTGGAAFTLGTDITNATSSFTNAVPQSLRACLGGQQGSVLDVFGGEYEWNNLQVFLHAARGRNRGVVLRYGKNITDLKQDETIENMYTAVMPYAQDSGGTAVLGTLQTIISSSEPKILNLDLSDKFNGTGTEPTPALINTAAQEYIDSHNLTVPKVTITVSFVALWQTEEYKDIAPLERVQLCDTVTVQFEKLGIQATAKVVKTVYNTLTERYDEIELGDAKSTLAQTINGIDDRIDAVANQKTSFMDATIASFSNLIANGMGLFMTGEQVGDATKWYLHNKPTRADSQYQWTVNAAGFAVSSDYGATWSAGFDSDGNAVFNSLAANIVKAMQIYAGTLTFGEDTTTTLSDNDNDTGALFQGDGTMEFRTKGQFYAQNLYSNGYQANYVWMNTPDINNANLRLGNMIGSNPAYFANTILLQKSAQNRYLYLENYESASTAWANQLLMGATSTSNYIYILNREISAQNYANSIQAYSNGTDEENTLALRNAYYGSSDTANIFQMEATDDEGRISLQNSTLSTGYNQGIWMSSHSGEAPLFLYLGYHSGQSDAWMSSMSFLDDGTIVLTPHNKKLQLDIGPVMGKTVGLATISGHTVLTLE